MEILGYIFLILLILFGILLILFGITVYKLDRLAFGGKWWTEGGEE
jgi:hypothetical protein